MERTARDLLPLTEGTTRRPAEAARGQPLLEHPKHPSCRAFGGTAPCEACDLVDSGERYDRRRRRAEVRHGAALDARWDRCVCGASAFSHTMRDRERKRGNRHGCFGFYRPCERFEKAVPIPSSMRESRGVDPDFDGNLASYNQSCRHRARRLARRVLRELLE